MSMNKYVIKLVNRYLQGNVYLEAGQKWTNDIAKAKTFDTVTGANAHAIMVLELTLEQFYVEKVKEIVDAQSQLN